MTTIVLMSAAAVVAFAFLARALVRKVARDKATKEEAHKEAKARAMINAFCLRTVGAAAPRNRRERRQTKQRLQEGMKG